jgi:hypothetical protein
LVMFPKQAAETTSIPASVSGSRGGRGLEAG